MPEKTSKEMVQSLYQAVVGIAENADENGLIGDIADIKELLQTQNKRISKAEGKVNKIWGVLIGVGAVGGTGLGIGIKSLLGG